MLEEMIILYTGCLQGEKRAPGCELWDLYDEVRKLRPDQTRCIVQIRTWKSDVKTMAAEIQRLSPRKVKLVGYSYGMGRAVLQLCLLLAAAGIVVDLVISIDGVPNYGWRWLTNIVAAFTPTDEPIVLPGNVKHFAYFRSVTEPLESPKGRPVESVEDYLSVPSDDPEDEGWKPEPRCKLAVAIGSARDLSQHARPGELQIVDVVTHDQMDGNDQVQSSCLKLLAEAA